MNDKCGYCGYAHNNIKELVCQACEHSPWTQYIKIKEHNNLDELIALLDLVDFDLESEYYDDEE